MKDINARSFQPDWSSLPACGRLATASRPALSVVAGELRLDRIRAIDLGSTIGAAMSTDAFLGTPAWSPPPR